MPVPIPMEVGKMVKFVMASLIRNFIASLNMNFETAKSRQEDWAFPVIIDTINALLGIY